MKSYKSMSYTLAALVAGLMLVSQSAIAQPPDGGGRRGGGGRGLGPDATPEQTAGYEKITTATADLTAKVAAARTELNDVIFADKLDEAGIKAKADVLAKAEVELALARAKAFDGVRATAKFTPEQITTMKAAGRGGRGGGRRGGQ